MQEATERSRRTFLAATGAVTAGVLAGCTGGSGTETDDSGYSAAWIYPSSVGDLGWNYANDLGAQATDEAFEDLTTESVEEVAVSDVEQQASQYAESGFDVVFGVSASYTDPIAAASEAYPDTAFEVAGGLDIGDNYGAYNSKLYQTRYLAGYASGLVTEQDRIGFVASNPVSTVVAEINGFAAGVKAANEAATVIVRWTNTWYDPATEAETAQAIIDDENVDVLAQYQDSPAAIETAAENGIWGSGYAASMRDFGGEHYLLSPVFNMEEVYTQIVEEVINGEWEAELTYLGMDAGAVDISEPGPNVPSDVVEEVETLREDMLETDTDEFVWDGTTFEDWSDAEIFFESDEFGIDNIEGESP